MIVPKATPGRRCWESQRPEVVETEHDAICLTTMIIAAAKKGDLVTAERLFQLGEEVEVEQVLTAVIDVAAKKGDVAAAKRCYQRAKEVVGIADRPKLGPKLGAIMIHAAARKGDLPAAERWYSRIEELELKPEDISFNTIIHAAMKKRATLRRQSAGCGGPRRRGRCPIWLDLLTSSTRSQNRATLLGRTTGVTPRTDQPANVGADA